MFSGVVGIFLFILLGLAGPNTAYAAIATSPNLGDAASFSVLAGLSMSAAGAGTTISGDLGLSPGLETSKTGPWTVGGSQYFGTTGLSATAQGAALIAYGNLAGQTTSGVWGTTPWTPVPGVWTSASDKTFTGTIYLNGTYDDVWVFQVGGDFTFSGSIVLQGNAQACHVFWQVGSSATIGSDSTFVGTLIAQTSVTLVSGATVNGRIIALNGSLTTDGNNISGPTCATAPVVATPVSGGQRYGTISVVKTVINDNGGTKTVADFPLFVNGTAVVSGQTNVFPAPAGVYSITETSDPNYTQTFSGDCNSTGHLDLNVGNTAVCIITNDDIGAPVVVPPVPPLIDVIKVPDPLALPAGPGPVAYTYTLRNIGTVPVTDLTMVGDTCSPINLISGDTNGDSKLDMDETWVYRCSTTLSETHTNTVVATGWANGISAVDIAHATVVVGAPIIPPLIHITKIPNPLTLLAGGGMVTYTKQVTNPGTVALSNVRVTDDKCSSVVYISGDTNSDSKLDPTETWTYTCRTRITKTTTNTAVVTGEANGLTVRDFAVATVVVTAVAPKLPNTGVASSENHIPWNSIILVGVLILISTSTIVVLKKRRI